MTPPVRPGPAPTINAARETLADAERARARLAAELAAATENLGRVSRTRGARDPQVDEAEAARVRKAKALEDAQARERAAKLDLTRVMTASLPDDPAGEVARLSADYPIVLFPVRIETRFVQAADRGQQLKLRIYPDDIFADSHEPALTAKERASGTVYWAAVRADPDHELEEWRKLLLDFPANRAAWIVRATEGEGAAAGDRSGSWTSPAQAKLLPDRWLVLGFRGGVQVLHAVSRPVHEPLPLTPDPSADPSAAVAISGDGPRLDPDVAWAYDFTLAEQKGMALTIALRSADWNLGFDRLLVLGVKSSLDPAQSAVRLAELLEAHHYGRGMAFVRQGTATNNTSAEPAGYPPPDTGGADSFATERRGVTLTAETDGHRFMRALGVPPEPAAHLAGADGSERQHARLMNEALWPTTFGYYLEQLMAPVFANDAIQDARRYFTEQVSGRGPFPAFRIGATPYGLLPVSSLTRWRADRDARPTERALPDALRRLRDVWSRRVPDVPRVGRTADPDGDLLTTLGMEASTREVRIRSALGPEWQMNSLGFFDFDGFDWMDWISRRQALTWMSLVALGHSEWRPRLLELSDADVAYPFSGPLVTEPAASETDLLPASYRSDAGLVNYLAWIAHATVDQLRAEQLGPGVQRPAALLYLMLRHSALTEYTRVAFDIQINAKAANPEDRFEHELVRIAPGTEGRPTTWERLDRPVPGVTGDRPLKEYLLATPGTPDTAAIGHYRDTLSALAGLPTAELERLFTETLDTCSHRLDAWITSLVSQRLLDQRTRRPAGSHFGAFAWVEELRRVPAGRDLPLTLADGRKARRQALNGGFVQAPSLTHAAAAAVLRNAYLSRSGDERARYAIDLSSARVRLADWLLDAVRNGQRLEAVLGYRVERGLHERRLDAYIEPLRVLFPMPTNTGTDAEGPTESVAPRDVVNGLDLWRTWHDTAIRWGAGGLPATGPDRDGLEAELEVLDDTVDTVTDLLMSTAVYQLVRGATGGAAASLDAIGQGARPPDAEIAAQPRGGTALTHRVALVLGGDRPTDPPGWTVTPRADAEPYFNAWVGTQLGDPANIRCRTSYQIGDPPHREDRPVSAADLELSPLDFLALVQGATPAAAASELDRRVSYYVLGAAPGASDLRITYEPDPTWDRATVASFPEATEVGRAIAALAGGARALRPEDLLPPESRTDAQTADRRGDEALERATDAATGALPALVGATNDLQGARDAAAAAGLGVDLDPLRQKLQAASLFGVPDAVPQNATGTGAALRDILLAQAGSALAELNRRVTRATRLAADAAALTDGAKQVAAAGEIMQAVFGDDAFFLARFKPAGAAELAQAIAYGPTLVGDRQVPRQWLQQAARVRTPLSRWRRVALYAEALGAAPPAPEVAQLPHVADGRWVGLPLPPGTKPPPSGRVSIVLHRAATPATDREWVGLLIDEWTELIPGATALTGVTFHYDDPGAEAAQTVLIAVPPVPPGQAATWDLPTLVEILNETLDLAKLRAVDLDLLGELGQLVPPVFLAANAAGETVATSFAKRRIGEPIVMAAEAALA